VAACLMRRSLHQGLLFECSISTHSKHQSLLFEYSVSIYSNKTHYCYHWMGSTKCDIGDTLKSTHRVQQKRCNVSQFIYFCKTFYTFQTVFPSIIRSSKMHIQRQVFVRPLLLPAASLARLAAGSSIGLTNTWRCMCIFELLMMDGQPVRNM